MNPLVVVIGLVAAALQWRSFSDPVRVVSTGPTLILGAALAALLVGTAWSIRRQGLGEVAPRSGKRSLPLPTGRGLRLAVGIVTVATVLSVGYHLAVPLAVAGSVRTGLFMASVTSFAAMAAVFTIAVQWKNEALMDGGLGLLSLGVCGLAVSAVPSYPASLAERYPVVLTALVAGLALATWLCTWLGLRPQRSRSAFGWRWGAIDAARHFKRFAFLNAVMGLLVAALMSVWPRLRWIAIPDDSLGRVTAGFGVHLLLLLVLLWSARRLSLITFHVLTIVAVVSSAGFMLMRAYPYTPQFQ